MLYVYVIGGCDPRRPAYRGYIYNILINSYIQQQQQQQATKIIIIIKSSSFYKTDTIVYFQLIHSIDDEVLPDVDVDALRNAGIIIHYIPKNHDESFYNIMLSKFVVLSLVEYDRVMFVDGDVTITNNLDYLFLLSTPTLVSFDDDSGGNSTGSIIKENVVFQGIDEPFNGGLFMVSPGVGDYDEILDIIANTRERGRFDIVKGFGHALNDDDQWTTLVRNRQGHLWDFYGAFADQGLLYHWIKYVKHSYSLVTRDSIENYGVVINEVINSDRNSDSINDDSSTNNNNSITTAATALASASLMIPRLEGKFSLDLLSNFSQTTKQQQAVGCYKGKNKFRACLPPHKDYVHFVGQSKPWLQQYNVPSSSLSSSSSSSSSGGGGERLAKSKYNKNVDDATKFWFSMLQVVITEYHLDNISQENWTPLDYPLLGLFPEPPQI